MKLNKKIFSAVIAAAMLTASVSAMAADWPTDGIDNYAGAPVGTAVNPFPNAGATNMTMPVPVYTGNVAATYDQALALYNQGFYFEAHVAISSIPATAPTVWQAIDIAALTKMIEDKIDRVIIDEAFADVEAFMADNYYAEAGDILINDVYNLALGNATASAITGAATGASEILYRAESFTLADWNRARSLEATIGTALGEIVNSADAALRRVEFMFGKLPADVWCDVVEVGTRYDVYVKTVAPNGVVVTVGEVDIAKNGTILLNTMPLPVKGVWENPIAY